MKHLFLCVLFGPINLFGAAEDLFTLLSHQNSHPKTEAELALIAKASAELSTQLSSRSEIELSTEFIMGVARLSSEKSDSENLWVAQRSLNYLLCSYLRLPNVALSTKMVIAQHLVSTLKRYNLEIERLKKSGAVYGGGGSLSGFGFSKEEIEFNRKCNELAHQLSIRDSVFTGLWEGLQYGGLLHSKKDFEAFFLLSEIDPITLNEMMKKIPSSDLQSQ